MTKKCEACKKKKLWFLLKHRTFTMPVGEGTMTSKSLLCKPCMDNIQKMLYK